MINDITAVPEIGKTYLGKVFASLSSAHLSRSSPGTDGLLHISEIAEHRVKDVKDELREGDQVMVKVLALEGNRIKLSRKALIKEQKAKLAAAQGVPIEEGATDNRGERSSRGSAPAQRVRRAAAALQPEHDSHRRRDDFDDDEDGDGEEIDEENEPNFNRVDGASGSCRATLQVLVAVPGAPSGPGANNRRRRRRAYYWEVEDAAPGQGGGKAATSKSSR